MFKKKVTNHDLKSDTNFSSDSVFGRHKFQQIKLDDSHLQ